MWSLAVLRDKIINDYTGWDFRMWSLAVLRGKIINDYAGWDFRMYSGWPY